MTYTSQQLAEALQKLARDGELPRESYAKRELPDSIETDIQFPSAVAEFLDVTSQYNEQTRTVSVGIY
jgi:hypothetical protein